LETHPMRRFLAPTLAAAAVFAAGPALAHARLVASSPAANAVTAPPGEIVLRFSERLEQGFSSIELMKADGAKVAATSTVSPDRTAMTAKPAQPLTPGVYMVMWKALSVDTHRSSGDFAFKVR
ncbi:MAG: copper homeostasis periplasmic binding protein CopC, partial [Caulobacteraceae bacterium]